MVDLKRNNPIFGFTSEYVKFNSKVLKDADNISDSSDRTVLHRAFLHGGANWQTRDEPTGAKPQAWARQLLQVFFILARYYGVDTANEFLTLAFKEGLTRLIHTQTIQDIFPSHVDDINLDIKLNIWQRADFTSPPPPLDLTVVNQFTYDELMTQLEITSNQLSQSEARLEQERESRYKEASVQSERIREIEERLHVTRGFVAPSKLQKCQIASREAVENLHAKDNTANAPAYRITNDNTAFTQ